MTPSHDFGSTHHAKPTTKQDRGSACTVARARHAFASLWLSLGLAACAALPPARMEVPAELSGAEAVTLAAAGTRSGGFELSERLGGGSVRFERSADRWSFFSTAEIDRALLTLRWQTAAQPAREQQCRLRRTGLQAAGVGVDVQPTRLLCEGAGARLELQARPGAVQAGRSGSVTSGVQRLDIRSVHRIQGAPLAQDDPVGYVLLQEGRPLAALDLLGSRPVLRVAAMAPAQRQVVVEAALLLALSWEPPR
jgi:hypothetical protein